MSNEDQLFEDWLAELENVTFKETGEKSKINKEGAREWFDSGATPYITFRENWQCDGD